MNQEITTENQSIKNKQVENKSLDKYKSGDSYTDRLGNVEGYGENTLRNMLERYCKNVLGYTQAQIEPLLADLSRQFSLHNGQKWLDDDPDAKAPYEYAHKNQWRLIEVQNGYLALEREVGNESRYGSFKWKIKARSNPAGMSNSDLWAQDYRFMRLLRNWGYRVDEDGSVLSDYAKEKNKRGRRKRIALTAALIGGLVASGTGVTGMFVHDNQSGKGQSEQPLRVGFGKDTAETFDEEKDVSGYQADYIEEQLQTARDQQAETLNGSDGGQEQEPSNPLSTDIDAEQELGTNEQSENLLEGQFKVNSKSWGLESVGLTQRAEQSGSRFNITDSNEWGNQPNIQFFMELIAGESGQQLLKISSDIGVSLDKLQFSELEITLFVRDGEPHSFIVRQPYEPVYIRLGQEYQASADGTQPSVRSFPFGFNDINGVNARFSTYDQSAGLIFEAVRQEEKPTNLNQIQLLSLDETLTLKNLSSEARTALETVDKTKLHGVILDLEQKYSPRTIERAEAVMRIISHLVAMDFFHSGQEKQLILELHSFYNGDFRVLNLIYSLMTGSSDLAFSGMGDLSEEPVPENLQTLVRILFQTSDRGKLPISLQQAGEAIILLEETKD